MINSKIISLEKKADIKGNPIKLNLEIKINLLIVGKEIKLEPVIRRS
jgi:hypothetical protein